MFKRKVRIKKNPVLASEALFLFGGARELTHEELLNVNGGRQIKDDPSTDKVSETIASGSSASNGGAPSSPTDSGSSGSNEGGRESSNVSSGKTAAGHNEEFGKGNGSGGDKGTGKGESDYEPSAERGEKSRTVKAGNTLSEIVHDEYPDLKGNAFVEKVKEVAKNSGIKDIDKIEVGEKIVFEKGSGERQGKDKAGGGEREETQGIFNAVREGFNKVKKVFVASRNKGTEQIRESTLLKKAKSFGAGENQSGMIEKGRNSLAKKGKAAEEQNQHNYSNPEKEKKLFSNQIIKQKELERKYDYPNTLCYATDLINIYRVKNGLSDEKVDRFMGKAKNIYIKADGEVLNFSKMSKELARESGARVYCEYIYRKEDGWRMLKLSEESFKACDYEFGIGEYYKTGGSDENICHYKLVQNNPWREYDPGIGLPDYTLFEIRPIQWLKTEQ